MVNIRYTSRLGLVVLCLLAGITMAFAQNTSVSGTVTDPQGNAVPNANVTLTSTTSGLSRNVVSSKEGAYQIPQVAPGIYRLTAEANGFKKLVQENVQVLVSTPLTLNISFKEVGAITETVTVTGGESSLNTSDATIGITFNEMQVKELPLLSRNVVGLLSLQPGVTADGYVNGGRADQANVTLDGIDVNDQQAGSAFFSVLRSTPDSLQEFRVTTTNPNADQGRSSGAQVALITKSGTNQFHGSLYEYHRNTVTSANDWFNNKDNVARPKLLRNNFGGSVGGPIKKDKLFFFFNYEGFREAKGTIVVRTVPLPTLGQGIVRYRSASGASDPTCPSGTPSGVICLTRTQISQFYLTANGIDPGTNSAALAVLAAAAGKYQANSTTVGDGLNTSGFRFNASAPVSQNTAIAKLDYNLTSRQVLFARFNYQNDLATNIRAFPDTPAPQTWNHPRGLAVGHAWTITNNLVNNFRYGITRDAFTVGGDSAQNAISFRFVYSPLNFSRGVSRTTPLQNFIDDVSWTKGTHAIQFGGNVRLISNSRTSYAAAYDVAVTNPSYYDLSGDVVLNTYGGSAIFPNVGGSPTDLRNALTAVIGRFSQYSLNLNYSQSGSLLGSGQGVARKFATQEYEAYGQDTWKFRPNLTITYGLRYSTSTPVYEANGVQVKPVQSLSGLFDTRVAGANNGVPYNGLITVDTAGKANGKPGYYSQDWNNFAPAIAVAWSPSFKNSLLKTVFGENKTTIRGGFRTTYDRIGSALAVAFDLNSTLGYTSATAISANTFNVSDALGPQFTGFGQNVRALPGLTYSSTLKFPLTTPADEDQRIESSLDDKLTTPKNYSMNLSIGRDLGHGFTFEASYVGRIARNLLVTRDIMHLNNLKDPKSGDTWYSAMAKLIALRSQKASITSVQKIAWFENIVPGLAGSYSVLGTTQNLSATQAAYRRIALGSVGGRNTTDYTFVQLLWDDGLGYGDNLFFHPQYAALSAWSTLGTSDYHSGQFSLRKRFSQGVSFDLNYTFGHSLDTASGLQSGGTYGAPFILNPLNLDVNRGSSDFDVRHIVNANYLVALPFGKGKAYMNKLPKLANLFIGGWETTGIFRWNSGAPIGEPFDDARWATNWNVQSNAVALTPVTTSPTRTGDPNLFSNPAAAFAQFRNAIPGEFGDRNMLNEPSYVSLDAGLYKSFKLPWEGVQVKFRWEVFNVTNTQHFTGISNFGVPQDPNLGAALPSDWGKFTSIQGSPRIMQFALRIEF